MAQSLNIEDHVIAKGPGFRMGRIYPRRGCTSWRALRVVVTEQTAGIDGSIPGFEHIVSEENRQNVCREVRADHLAFEKAKRQHSDKAAAPQTVCISLFWTVHSNRDRWHDHRIIQQHVIVRR